MKRFYLFMALLPTIVMFVFGCMFVFYQSPAVFIKIALMISIGFGYAYWLIFWLKKYVGI
jgi:hypothetical protein